MWYHWLRVTETGGVYSTSFIWAIKQWRVTIQGFLCVSLKRFTIYASAWGKLVDLSILFRQRRNKITPQDRFVESTFSSFLRLKELVGVVECFRLTSKKTQLPENLCWMSHTLSIHVISNAAFGQIPWKWKEEWWCVANGNVSILFSIFYSSRHDAV